MPTNSTRQRTQNFIGTKRVAELLLPFINSGAEWYMTPSYALSKEPSVGLSVALVVWHQGQELNSWPLHLMTYGSLVSNLVQQPAGPFAIPHAEGFTYDEYAEVDNRLDEAKQVLQTLIPPYNALLYRMASVEETAGLIEIQVSAWLKEAEQTLHSTKGKQLWSLMREVGPPRFATHSSFLPELLPSIRQATEVLKHFLAHFPPPTDLARPGELATAGKESSKWAWVQLAMPNKEDGLFLNLEQQKFDYLPEVEFNEAPFDFDSEKKDSAPSQRAFARAEEAQRPDDSVRGQLLDIKQRIDSLLSQLD